MKLKISELKQNPNNPRIIKDDKFKKLVQSIKDFPEMLDAREIVVNKDHIILGGNMRFKAAKEAGLTEVPVKIVDWDEDKQRQFIIKDNVSGGEWDWDVLANEWDAEELDDWGLDLPAQFGDEEEKEQEDFYTEKIEAPVYEIKGEKPTLEEMMNTDKTKELIKEIETYELDETSKQLLLNAANRHIVFNYAKIAEYYAHQDKTVQELIENSALVIIDFDKAIEKGFTKLSENTAKHYEDEN